MLHVVGMVADVVTQVYVMLWNTWALLYRCRPDVWPRNAIFEMRPLVLVAIPLRAAFYDIPFGMDHPAWMLILLSIDAVWFWIAWTTKDDRWKKRRKKLAAKVKEVGGKLVVVPVSPVPVSSRSL